jgi:hypothetical protein
VKKIALALVAVSALGIAGCQGNTATVDQNASDAINQANSDIANAQEAASNLLDQTANVTEQAGAAAQNATDAAAAAVQNATDTAQDTAADATDGK